MKRILLTLAIMALCVPAFAQCPAPGDTLPVPYGGNPSVKMFISFNAATVDVEDIQPRTDPAQYSNVIAYVGVCDLEAGLTSAAFRITLTEGMSSPPSYTNYLPGDLAIGNPFADGVVVAATECQEGSLVIIGAINLFYLGVPGDVLIEDFINQPGETESYARWILDCNPDEPYLNCYCVANHGGVGKDPVPGDENCVAGTPVEASSWSAIKALYNR